MKHTGEMFMGTSKSKSALRKRMSGSKHVRSVKLVLVLFLLISGGLWFRTWSVKQEISQVRQVQEEVTAQIEDEKKNQEAILEKVEYLRSDAYIEDLAREKLGLIYDNEIIFKKQR